MFFFHGFIPQKIIQKNCSLFNSSDGSQTFTLEHENINNISIKFKTTNPQIFGVK